MGCKCGFPLADDGDEDLNECCHHNHDDAGGCDHDHEHESEHDNNHNAHTNGHNDNITLRDGQNPKLILPRIIGHRGACGYAPENTIESFHVAADMGIEMVEFDVKLTKDLVPIVFHDDMLERTTNGHGAVADMTLKDIRTLDAGSWFAVGLSDSFSSVGIPTLEEAIDTFIERGLGINMEIKPCPGREVETAEAALDVLSQYWDDHNNLLISSFSEVSLETAAHIAPGWARGYLINDIPENWRDMAKHLGATTININGNSEQISRSLIENMIQEGYRIGAYTINDPERAALLLSWGVDALFTDYPDVLLDIIPPSRH